MSDYKWDEFREGQLGQLDGLLDTIRNANEKPKPGVLSQLAGASVIADSLVNGVYPSFILFLHGQAREQKRVQRQVDEMHELLDDFERMITHSEDADTTVNQIVERIHRMRETHQVR